MKINKSTLFACYTTFAMYFLLAGLCFFFPMHRKQKMPPMKIPIQTITLFLQQSKKQTKTIEQSKKKQFSNIGKQNLPSNSTETYNTVSFFDNTTTTSQEIGEPNFLTEIHEKISTHLKYPERARKRNIEGVVIIKVYVNPQGKLEKYEKLSSSGTSILDVNAEALILSIFPLQFPPPLLSDAVISIRYELKSY